MKCTNKEQETCQVEKMGCDGCAYREKSADEMFAELGYEKIDRKLYKTILFTNGNKKFYFHKVFHKIKCVEYDNEEEKFMDSFFTMQELQAIIKKCEELKWI